MAKDDYALNTPPDLLQKVRRLAPGQGIGLDPCSNPTSLTKAKVEWYGLTADTTEHRVDGLQVPWRGHGLVFMNPPHSMSPHNIEPWIEKAAKEFPLADGRFGNDQFVGLIPAKPDTAWFHDYVTEFRVRVFLRGRLVYWTGGMPTKGPGKFGSMLIYAGANPGRFEAIFGGMGWVA